MNVIYKIGQAIKDIQDKMDLMEDGESIDWYIEGNDLVILVDTGEYRYVLASVNVKNGHLTFEVRLTNSRTVCIFEDMEHFPLGERYDRQMDYH